jgi:hypothetical protein
MHSGDTLLIDPDLSGLNPAVQVDPSATPNRHLWIVVTEPQPPDFQCVIVNITRQQQKSDNTVVLRPGDHPFIVRDSVIRYADASIVDVRDLDRCLANRVAKPRDACSAELLKRIQGGISVSIFTPKKVVDFCKRHLPGT